MEHLSRAYNVCLARDPQRSNDERHTMVVFEMRARTVSYNRTRRMTDASVTPVARRLDSDAE